MTWLTDLERLAREPVDNAFVAACTPARLLALIEVAKAAQKCCPQDKHIPQWEMGIAKALRALRETE
jgi:hypothetical protein